MKKITISIMLLISIFTSGHRSILNITGSIAYKEPTMKHIVTFVVLIFSFFGFSQTQIYECIGQTKEMQGGIIVTVENNKPEVVPLSATNNIRYEINTSDSSIYIQSESNLTAFSELKGTYTYKKKPFTFRDTNGELKTAYLTYPDNELRNEFSTILITVGLNKIVLYGVDKQEVSFEIHTPILKQWEVEDLSHLKIKLDSTQESQIDCVFDQSTQTDEFLDSIDFFKGYVWNDSTKTARLQLFNGEILKIHRGGCYHYSVSATIEMDSKMKLYPIEHFIHYFFTIASKLPQDFDYETVTNEIINKNYTVMEYDGSTKWRFNDENLRNNHYYISLEQLDDKVEFSFGWRL